MRKGGFALVLLSAGLLFSAGASAQQAVPFPKDWSDWTHVTTTVVNDKTHPAYGVRHIYVNDKGKQAALSGATSFPDGSALILVFYNIVSAQVPNPKGGKSPKLMMGKRFRLDLMAKDSGKYAKTGGWNYARYSLPDEKFQAKVNYEKACFRCHSRVKALDFVFTRAPR
ncbi:MAG: cytochrome P460 family protein [Nitrospinota bacterium]